MSSALDGVKVIDFGWAASGPAIGKCLADYGAQVVRIESSKRPDILRISAPYKEGIPGQDRSGFFARHNVGKYGITLNLKHEKGIEIAKRLVAWADVITEGFVPGTMKRLGLGYEELIKIKPEIVMVSSSNLGQTGIQASRRGLGPQLTCLAGFAHITGWPDRGSCYVYGAYTDYIAPKFAVTTLLAALDHRDRTGNGQYLDLSQYEAALQFLSPLLLDYSINGRVAGRIGNKDDRAVPHAVYPCLDSDTWCAIAVFTDEEWRSFCKILENPAWSEDPKFSTFQKRKENEDYLDLLISDWSINFRAGEVMSMMQAAGIAAGVVQMPKEVLKDVQMAHRGYFTKLKHPVLGEYNFEGSCSKLSETPAKLTMPSPCLGEHNYFVCTNLLGMSEEEFMELLDDGVLG